MKKIILLCVVGLTTLMSIEFTMSKNGLYPNTETQTPATPPSDSDWIEAPLPTKEFNVRNYGLKGDGITDDSAALKALANNTSVTNWYFPEGYSFLIKEITIPSHVEAVYGTGTIICKANTRPDGAYYSARGALILDAAYDGLIIDGLTIIQEAGSHNTKEEMSSPNPDKWPFEDPIAAKNSSYPWRWYGAITILANHAVNDIEIRNITFDMANFHYNAIKAFSTNTPNTNMRIHHNTIKNYWEFGFEIFGSSSNTDRGITGCHINNNTFEGVVNAVESKSSRAISFVFIRGGIGDTGIKDGTENYIHDNNIDVGYWGIEYSGCSGLYIHNNSITGISSAPLYAGQGGIIPQIGKNFIFNNHITGDGTSGSKLIMYNQDEVYENYIDSYILFEQHSLNDFGYWHDNTIVINNTDSYQAIVKMPYADSVTFDNNEFYFETGVPRGIYILAGDGGSNSIFTNNTFNMKSASATCLSLSLENSPVESNNVCNPGWSGSIPPSRPAAGLK